MSEDARLGQHAGWTLEHLGLAAADLGAWSWEIATNRVTWSDGVYRVYGREPGTFDETFEAYLAMIHPLDREPCAAKISAALGSNVDDWSIEHRIAGFDPERWVSCRGRVFRDESGKGLRMAGVVQDVTRRRRAEREQTELSALMHAALEASAFAVTVLDPSGQIVFCNTRGAALLGLTRKGAEGRRYDAKQFKHTDVDGGPWPDEKQPFVRVMATGEPVHNVEHAIEWPDGKRVILRINGSPIKDESGNIKLVVFSFEDISERRALDEAWREAQKMEAMGRLAGGVAHDFNNLLTIILSFAALARGEQGVSKSTVDCIDSITDAAERAAALTRQLLAFGRRDPNHPTVFDVRPKIAEGARLIERALGAQIPLTVSCGPEPSHVNMDERQLHQVLLNLAVNARDAMPNGGHLVISVDNVVVDTTSRVELPRGSYARLRVADDGTGMDEATRLKAMEPFFTTKRGEGSGLGLSSCHGIVAQAGGAIAIESELGRGTTITIHLPLVEPPAAVAPVTATKPPDSAQDERHECVLVVEDDPAVRLVAVRSLRVAGFDVLSASDGDEALAVARAHGRPLDVVVCDVVLRRQSGFDVVERLRAEHPEVPALFVSGYTPELSRLENAPFLAKPFKPQELRAMVRRILDRPS